MEKVISKLLAAGRSLGGIVIALMAAMSVSSCNEAENDSQMVNQSISLDISMEGWDRLDATRASYSAMSESSGSKLFGMSFTSGDAIGLFACDKTGKVVIANQKFTYSGSAWTTDTPIEYVPGMYSDYTYFAYYPWAASLTGAPALNSTPNMMTAETFFSSAISAWTPAADQSTLAAFTGSDLMVAKGTKTIPYFHEVNVSFSLAHQMALAVTKNELSYYDIDDPTNTWSEPQTFSGNIPYAIGTEKYFIVKPGVETTLGTKSTTLAARQVEQMYFTNGEPVYVPATDLSMVDNAGNERASMSTANCYLVHAAGKYKLPLVYGNAIKNGAVNTVAFYPGKDGSITNGTDRFVNHNGDGITGPWITKSGSGVDTGMGLTAASAELLWQDANGLITAVGIDGDYLAFTVGTFAGGNALIAVKDGSGTILWSWHIWATSETLERKASVSSQSHTYYIPWVNLGWVPTGGDGEQGYCPYYQWGRKDPFIPCNGTTNGNTNKTVYNIVGTEITGIAYSRTDVTIADNIKNPTTHYCGGSDFNPVTTAYYNVWDAQNTATDNVPTVTKKTIYDPCPPGFCVPPGDLWYHFGGNANPTGTNNKNDANWDSANNGKRWFLYGYGTVFFFPAVGGRNDSSGNLGGVGSAGNYWSATPQSPQTYQINKARRLYFTSSMWSWQRNNRANGYPIRPVAEE